MIIEDGVLLNVTTDETKGHFTIPDGVTSIGSGVFSFCSGLTGVTIPDSVTSIGNGAFYHCSLKSVTVPDSVTSIGCNVFQYCSHLKNVVVGNGITSIGYSAFFGCFDLTNVTIGNNVTSIGLDAFACCDNLKSKVANYKAFFITSSGKLSCLGTIYREKRKSSVRGKLKLCRNGIHYCTNLFEIFDHYSGELNKDIAIYECDVSDENIGEEGTSKRCARWIVPKKRLYREDVIRILNGGE